jgi:hypothetical protein
MFKLEIKPCGLGSRIRDMEAESYNGSHLLIGEHLDYFLFLLVSRTGTVGWTEHWVKVPKCVVAVCCLASSSHHGGKK